ncbi:MAG TPA: iron-sulfur cluster assembly accessory protein [Nitriliruptorales bacterium]|nr:iron-sulfur cluster assembly accessory protein [Nitriliruptorales bacterium]
MSDTTHTTVKETLDGPPVRETLAGFAPAYSVTLTEHAAVKVKEFLAQQDAETDHVALRVAVQAGGCAGMQYALFFDDRQLEGDEVSVQHGVAVRLDRQSKTHLIGATIDWKESLEASGFQIDNPNAHSSCACGESFS